MDVHWSCGSGRHSEFKTVRNVQLHYVAWPFLFVWLCFFFQALIDLLPHIHNSKYNSHTIGQLWPYSWHISCCFFTLCTHWMYFYTIMNQNYRILCIFCLICKGLYIACQNGKSNVQNFKYKTGTTAGQQLYRWSFLNEQKRKNRQTISSFNCNWRSWQVLMIY